MAEPSSDTRYDSDWALCIANEPTEAGGSLDIGEGSTGVWFAPTSACKLDDEPDFCSFSLIEVILS